MPNHKQMIRFFTFSMFHNKIPFVGSDFIRALQVIKYWPGAELYKYGEFPDVLIFTKVFMAADYKFIEHFENIKILDICDPMWMEGLDVTATARAVDAVTTPTKAIQQFMQQLTDKPVYVVPDRFDLENIPPPKEHVGQAKTVAWFGYSHNAESLRPALELINQLGLKLLIISNDDPLLYRFTMRPKEEFYSFKKYDEDTIYQDLQKADFIIFPNGTRPQDRFKSNNKTIKSILAGLPVAADSDQVNLFMSAKERNNFMNKHYNDTKEDYDVRKSVEDYKDIINDIKRTQR
jgi:hypothetical protein